jgi:hypothetical protein
MMPPCYSVASRKGAIPLPLANGPGKKNEPDGPPALIMHRGSGVAGIPKVTGLPRSEENLKC